MESVNGEKPYINFADVSAGEKRNSNQTAVVNTEEGEDDVKSSRPLCLGLHTYYNGCYKEKRNRKVEQN